MDELHHYYDLLEEFVKENRRILKDNLVGVYLHGSAVMGCFRENKSDLDLLVVVNKAVSDKEKREYMDMVVELNEKAPAKGMELSIVRKEVCAPFVYPTPFELHFSIAHLEWYKTNPADYVEKMNGTDRDLAAHFTILYHRGKTLFGKEIKEVFEEVDPKFYFDSIRNDIENAKEDIARDPVDIILNLCRVLAYKKEGLILSKAEGAEWGRKNLPEKYQNIILQASEAYSADQPLKWEEEAAAAYAAYMLGRIENYIFGDF